LVGEEGTDEVEGTDVTDVCRRDWGRDWGREEPAVRGGRREEGPPEREPRWGEPRWGGGEPLSEPLSSASEREVRLAVLRDFRRLARDVCGALLLRRGGDARSLRWVARSCRAIGEASRVGWGGCPPEGCEKERRGFPGALLDVREGSYWIDEEASSLLNAL
jgi:hypothetical protein